jgi:hypothetical protein
MHCQYRVWEALHKTLRSVERGERVAWLVQLQQRVAFSLTRLHRLQGDL